MATRKTTTKKSTKKTPEPIKLTSLRARNLEKRKKFTK